MDFINFQEQAEAFARYPESTRVWYPALGLAGEVGEVTNKVKKVFRDDGGVVTYERREDLKAEIGDCLWYCAALASDLDLSLDEIAEDNISKLQSRADRGVLQGSGDNR